MAETFYGTLGVAEDADDRTIERAYRERVKRAHPDVSDDPDAPARFKRLTAARDVLLDEAERARYDRLGHAAYVREHLDSPAWVETTAAAGQGPDRAPDAGKAHPRPGSEESEETPADERIGWLGTDRDPAETSASGGQAAGAGGSTEYGGHGWQRAATYYERTETASVDHDSTGVGLVTVARRVGPWLVVHAVFILSALATVWFTYTEANEYAELSASSLVVGTLLFGFVILVSAVHILSRVHR